MDEMDLEAAGTYSEMHQGLNVDAGRHALRQLASILRIPGRHTLRLREPLTAAEGYRSLKRLTVDVRDGSGERIQLHRKGTELLMQGGRQAMELLADTIDDLSTTPYRVTPHSVPSHLDLNYFEGNEMLEDTGFGLTVTMADEEIPAGSETA
jgi:hypothetical protein